jgi:hypothetical protein
MSVHITATLSRLVSSANALADAQRIGKDPTKG